jgi:hypothetical protein
VHRAAPCRNVPVTFTLCRMKAAHEPSHGATWTKAWIVVALVGVGVAAAIWFAPDRYKEARECEAKCKPRAGVMVPDPRFKNSFKGGIGAAPKMCTCT